MWWVHTTHADVPNTVATAINNAVASVDRSTVNEFLIYFCMFYSVCLLCGCIDLIYIFRLLGLFCVLGKQAPSNAAAIDDSIESIQFVWLNFSRKTNSQIEHRNQICSFFIETVEIESNNNKSDSEVVVLSKCVAQHDQMATLTKYLQNQQIICTKITPLNGSSSCLSSTLATVFEKKGNKDSHSEDS